MPERKPTLYLRGATCLAILLANASCMPATRWRLANAAAAPAPSPHRDAGTQAPTMAYEPVLADPPPALLAPSATQDGDASVATSAAPAFDAAGASSADAERATECLTEAVYYEARSEPVDGQRAVAQVVLNRVRNPAFPASVCGVVHQRAATGGCQFTYVCDGSMRGRREPAAWERARGIARDALSGAVYAPAGAATYYHTTAVSPWWAPRLTRIAAIGAHIFYRLGDAVGRRLDFHQAYADAEPAGTGTDSEALLAANVMRYLTPDGNGVAIHRGAVVGVAGVVVHHGTQSEDAPIAETAGVRVHIGSSPVNAAAASTDGPAAPDSSTPA